LPPTDRYVATAQFHVRYAETDAQGVVHHSSYVVWFEESRSHYARSMGVSYADMEKGGYFMAVTGLEIKYRVPLHYDELVAIDCWVHELKSRTVAFKFEVHRVQDGALCATAHIDLICITREGQITRWPEQWRHWLSGEKPEA
jgi:acyl-CoA thioester hydrolase